MDQDTALCKLMAGSCDTLSGRSHKATLPLKRGRRKNLSTHSHPPSVKVHLSGISPSDFQAAHVWCLVKQRAAAHVLKTSGNMEHRNRKQDGLYPDFKGGTGEAGTGAAPV